MTTCICSAVRNRSEHRTSCVSAAVLSPQAFLVSFMKTDRRESEDTSSLAPRPNDSETSALSCLRTVFSLSSSFFFSSPLHRTSVFILSSLATQHFSKQSSPCRVLAVKLGTNTSNGFTPLFSVQLIYPTSFSF